MEIISSANTSLPSIRISRIFSQSIINQWWKEIIDWDGDSNKAKAYETLENAFTGANLVASVDNHDKLVAIASYMTITSNLRLSMMSDVRRNRIPRQLSNIINDMGMVFIYSFAGNGKGGGRLIIEDLKRVAIEQELPLFLNSSEEARSFYTKMGFKRVSTSNHYYWIQNKSESST